MKKSIKKILTKVCAVIVCSFFVFGSSVPPPPPTFQVGDVFVAVSNGLVKWYSPLGALKGTLNTGLGGFTTGMAFDAAGNLYVTGFGTNTVSKFNTSGVLQGAFGSGYSTPESIVFNLAGHALVGNLGNGIREYDAAGNFITSDLSGDDWFDLAADQCTVLHTHEGQTIGSFNTCTNTANADFASGLGGSAFALRIRSGGDVLLANGANVKRLSSAGALLQTYTVGGESSWFALNLDPDNTTFWSANFGTANVYRINIATGAVITTFNTGTGGGTVFGLAVFGEVTVGGGGGGGCTCIQCEGQVLVDQNTTINLNGNNPATYYSGDPDLAPYFTADKSGPTPDTWKAVFNTGAKKIILAKGVTISMVNVPNSTNNQAAPGMEFRTTCDVLLDTGSHILINALNQNSGNILFDVKGSVTMNGEVINQVSGTNNHPGAITVNSSCGNITVGQTGLVNVQGGGGGGDTITLATCASNCNNGDITINGLVKSFAHNTVNLVARRPVIRVASMNGKVRINANTAEPLYDEYLESGGRYDIYGGLLSWSRDNVPPGKVEVQAKDSVIVNGHGVDPTGPVRTSFGAIAAVSNMSEAPGGLVDVRSLNSSIVGNDRAFDVSGRNRLAINYAHINLAAKNDIKLNRLGADNSFNPVVDASSPSIGDKGGLTTLRAHLGGITVGAFAMVSASVPAGLGSMQGTNDFTYCSGYTNSGTVTPAAVTHPSMCSPTAPDPIFTDICVTIVVDGGNERTVREAPLSEPTTVKTGFISAYPNPMGEMATIMYGLATPEKVTMKVFNIAGKEVATLVNSDQTVGQHKVLWNAEGMQTGVYFVHMTAGSYNGITKLVLIE